MMRRILVTAGYCLAALLMVASCTHAEELVKSPPPATVIGPWSSSRFEPLPANTVVAHISGGEDYELRVPLAKSLSEDERSILRHEKFSVISSVSYLPASVQKGLSWLTKARNLEMANPNSAYQATDQIEGSTRLPSRRLRFAALSPSRCLIHYEAGGYAHSFYLVAFSLDNGKVNLLWGGGTFKPFEDLSSAVTAACTGKLDSDRSLLY